MTTTESTTTPARAPGTVAALVARFVHMPPANEPPHHPLRSYYCDDCCEPDYVDTWDGGSIREFYHDTERDLYICEPCMRKANAHPHGTAAPAGTVQGDVVQEDRP